LPISLVTPGTLHTILTARQLLISEGRLNRQRTWRSISVECPLEDSRAAILLTQNSCFPMRLSPDTFLNYQLDYHYCGLAVDQRDFTLLTEADLQRCTTSSVTICPAEVPLYPSQVLTCDVSLFFQSSDSFQLCRKILLRHYRTQTLIHHGSKWAYHFPEPRQVTIRCPQENGRSSRTVSLDGSGLIHNMSACHISSQEVRTIPVLSRAAEVNLDASSCFCPTVFQHWLVTRLPR